VSLVVSLVFVLFQSILHNQAGVASVGSTPIVELVLRMVVWLVACVSSHYVGLVSYMVMSRGLQEFEPVRDLIRGMAGPVLFFFQVYLFAIVAFAVAYAWIASDISCPPVAAAPTDLPNVQASGDCPHFTRSNERDPPLTFIDFLYFSAITLAT